MTEPEKNPQKIKDEIFAKPFERVNDFNFGEKTAAVFDDMLERSVPMYAEMQRMTGELVPDFVEDGDIVYDLGCSTCNTFFAIDAHLPKEKRIRFIGLDNSEPMLDKSREKLDAAGFRHDYDLRFADLNKPIEISNAQVVIMTLTLQFIRPLYRESLLKTIFDGMKHNGLFVLIEKVLGEHSTFNRLFIKHYYDLKKKHGYTDLEIAQKREALENVLIPYRHFENVELLRSTGFSQIDTFFKWYNFCGMAAIK